MSFYEVSGYTTLLLWSTMHTREWLVRSIYCMHLHLHNFITSLTGIGSLPCLYADSSFPHISSFWYAVISTQPHQTLPGLMHHCSSPQLLFTTCIWTFVALCFCTSSIDWFAVFFPGHWSVSPQNLVPLQLRSVTVLALHYYMWYQYLLCHLIALHLALWPTYTYFLCSLWYEKSCCNLFHTCVLKRVV